MICKPMHVFSNLKLIAAPKERRPGFTTFRPPTKCPFQFTPVENPNLP